MSGGYDLPPEQALRTPAAKRISLPVSERLRTIVEGDRTSLQALHFDFEEPDEIDAGAAGTEPSATPPVPPKSILRKQSSASSLPDGPGFPLRPYSSNPDASTSSSSNARRSRQPAYQWITEALAGENEPINPAADEKLTDLRSGRDGRNDTKKKRGGWWRLALIAAILLVVVGLAVGLGVGLTVGRQKQSSTESGGSSGTSGGGGSTHASFPLGQYSLLTMLKTVDTSCTSNSLTWNCYPFNVYSPSIPGSNASSAASFDWIIANTSASYATNATGSTPAQGIPANLTITSSSNYFNILFTNQSLTYISEASNSSSARYTFSFNMSKMSVPRTAITTDGSQSECFFNQTTFTGTMYLSATADNPEGQSGNAGIAQGSMAWPYAVEVTQSSPGGENVPACYDFVSGVLGSNITSAGLIAQPASSRCLCEYNNF